MDIDLVPVEHLDNSDEPQVDPAAVSGLTCVGNSRVVTDLVLVSGRYIAIEYLDDGDGPIPDSED